MTLDGETMRWLAEKGDLLWSKANKGMARSEAGVFWN
jgi:hypothetical protein